MEKNQNTIKALIDRLEAKGLVERTVNLQDKRNLILTVTTGKRPDTHPVSPGRKNQ